ncbi:hypothetical protein [Burkholderia glumae]|uniref:Uncharacterized protein n=1 Tax=Burkholderia glumae TaxID=337 RepID=A0AAQ0BV32_BURGL|nr:hypothetical protein [Burkholderia glumae]AJY66529.1 hypothetical protein KS03_3157 [Burkholderia glumae LMG 2196 = ATCC 33617]KHJ61157.1 hypothetical protein NCPPB3923_20235 [Burkholderia glumae]MCM2482851.1 hypothetical protein [Burkholderia glumae]MCM2493701.1 hypothetical protein [Burkholderia glumae]MCM2506166.1 hypothetical protein [Burkholderia glumae]
MSFKEKIGAFVARHGLTYKAYVLSILFMPPAALYIAWKRPGLPVPGRVLLGVTGVLAPPLIGVLTAVIAKRAFDVIHAVVVG